MPAPTASPRRKKTASLFAAGVLVLLALAGGTLGRPHREVPARSTAPAGASGEAASAVGGGPPPAGVTPEIPAGGEIVGPAGGGDAGADAASGEPGAGSEQSVDPADPLAYLVLRHYESEPGGTKLKRSQATRDLDILQKALDGRYSYAKLRGLDYHRALGLVRTHLGETIDQRDLAIQIAKVMALFGDGHTRVNGVMYYFPKGRLPFLIEDARGSTVALAPDRSRFYVDGMPYLAAIDGVEIERWREAVRRLVPCGTEAMLRTHAVPVIAFVRMLRRELGIPPEGPPGTPEGTARVDLGSEPGKVDAVMFATIDHDPARGKPRDFGETRRLDGDIGYIRIPQMTGDGRVIGAIEAAMTDFASTKGLVIDVRGNGGGTRDILLTLAPYFLATDEPLHIVNLAAVRRHVENPSEDQLEDRFISPADDPRWRPEERGLVRSFIDRFDPEWDLPKEEFGRWNLLTVRPGEGDTYYYGKPVVFLMDGGCYSATDVFLSAFQGRARMTLLGTPSGGGSGWPQGVRLPDSRIDVSMSSMASFRADGTLFEGRGVIPDILVEPTPDDLLGKTDTQLAAAVELLTSGVRPAGSGGTK